MASNSMNHSSYQIQAVPPKTNLITKRRRRAAGCPSRKYSVDSDDWGLTTADANLNTMDFLLLTGVFLSHSK